MLEASSPHSSFTALPGIPDQEDRALLIPAKTQKKIKRFHLTCPDYVCRRVPLFLP